MASMFDTLLEAAHRIDGASAGARAGGRAGGSATSDRAPFASMHDDELLAAARDIETLGKSVDLYRAQIAGELARRSTFDRGYDGLAVRMGHRTPENLVRFLTGISHAESSKRVRVGVALGDEQGTSISPIADAVCGGSIGLDQADSILRSLGPVNVASGSDQIKATSIVIEQLVGDAADLDADSLGRAARIARETLDREGSVGREADLLDKRFLRIGPEIDGMRRLHGLLDPESAAILIAACDHASNPRRGGPRFVDQAEKARADRVIADLRTNDQLHLDTVIDLLRAGIAIGDKTVLGARRPAVRVVISAKELSGEVGTGWIEGSDTPLSVHSVRRIACDVGWLPVTLDTRGEILDVGVTQRLFTSSQRTALAVRDGGCRWPGCDRPPSWCEAHHLEEWSHGGATSVENGALLCRHHHMLIHNNGWRVERPPGTSREHELRAVPPPNHDLIHEPIILPVKRRVAR